MAVRAEDLNLPYEPDVAIAEHERMIHALEERVRSLELERDQAYQAVQQLTNALRRRGCCDTGA